MSNNREMFKENMSILSEGCGRDWKKLAKNTHAYVRGPWTQTAMW